ncbi:hypothetical protein Tco_0925869 [Tanacetum coccineum]|uniref:Uncharacterized protein n=1 Tax=Tanacetum coccineum TaxID=301880 RepID=A0ABQ5D853_9ASTR
MKKGERETNIELAASESFKDVHHLDTNAARPPCFDLSSFVKKIALLSQFEQGKIARYYGTDKCTNLSIDILILELPIDQLELTWCIVCVLPVKLAVTASPVLVYINDNSNGTVKREAERVLGVSPCVNEMWALFKEKRPSGREKESTSGICTTEYTTTIGQKGSLQHYPECCEHRLVLPTELSDGFLLEEDVTPWSVLVIFKSSARGNSSGLDSRLNSKKSIMDHSFGSAEEVDHVRILQSCNGLLLCSAIVYLDWHLIIENQVTTKWCKLEAKLVRLDQFYLRDRELELLQRPVQLLQLHLEEKIFSNHVEVYFFLLVCGDDIGSTEFTIYEMMKGSSVWSIRYLVNIEQLMNPLPKGWSIRTSVWIICLGEGEKDAFVVINLSGNVIKYNIISKINTEIFYIGSNQMDDDDDDDVVVFISPFKVDPNFYEFIQSLASV